MVKSMQIGRCLAELEGLAPVSSGSEVEQLKGTATLALVGMLVISQLMLTQG